MMTNTAFQRHTRPAISLVVIGDELLGGFVADVHTRRVAERVRESGTAISRVYVVPDDVAEVAEVLRLELGRSRPRLILTTGGLGPTPDDITCQAVARALHRRLVPSVELQEQLEQTLAPDAPDGHRALGSGFGTGVLVPEEAQLHMCRGWVGAVSVSTDGGHQSPFGATILSLPGVPEYLQTMLDELVVPRYLGSPAPEDLVVEVEHELPEAALVMCLNEVRAHHHAVKVGSYPGDPSVIRLQGARREVHEASRMLRARLASIARGYRGAHGVLGTWTTSQQAKDPEVPA